LNCDLYTK